jgi:hypothetical protein
MARGIDDLRCPGAAAGLLDPLLDLLEKVGGAGGLLEGLDLRIGRFDSQVLFPTCQQVMSLMT